MNTYNALNQPWKAGSLEIKNRIGVAPITGGAMYRPEGGFTDTAINYFSLRARGGFGFIITGGLVADYEVDPYSVIGPSILLTPDTFRESAKRLNEETGKYGAKMFAQITMGLGRNYPDLPAPSPMPVYAAPGKISPELTKEQIHKKIDAVVRAAKLAQDSGFSGVEVHSIHWGYLLDQFAMSFFNHRKDEYGGSLENRLRAAKEILEGIKQECGSDFPVSMRLGLKTYISGLEHGTLDGTNEVGRTLEEGVAIAKLLESYGYDMLDVDAGIYDSFYYACPPCYIPKGFMIDLAQKAKEAVKIPVIAGGRMNDWDAAEQAIRNGKIDGIVTARASLADPDYPNKLFSGHPEKIRPCLGCNIGCLNRLLNEGLPTCCAVNPSAMRELEYDLKPAGKKLKVLVIGGGVGGMEAARASALRGFDVELVEKSNTLGGHLKEAGAHDFKKEVRALNEWYQRELSELHVKIRFNHEFTKEEAGASDADVLIVAAGSTPTVPPVKGRDLPNVLVSLDAIDHPEKIGDNVVIVGGGLVGCEIAYDLVRKDKQVTVVEGLDKLMAAGGMPAPTPNRQFILESFEKYGVNVLLNNMLSEVRPDEIITVENNKEHVIKADTVIFAVGFRRSKAFDDFDSTNKKVITIGDAKQPRTIKSAIWDAYEAVSRL